ncbi:MAG: hypothetical protein ACKPKO_02630, partial [Candidatus Fonsibacter sp.]
MLAVFSVQLVEACFTNINQIVGSVLKDGTAAASELRGVPSGVVCGVYDIHPEGAKIEFSFSLCPFEKDNFFHPLGNALLCTRGHNVRACVNEAAAV